MNKHRLRGFLVVSILTLLLSLHSLSLTIIPALVQASPAEATQDPTNTYFVAGRWRTPTFAYASDDSYAWTLQQASWQGYYEYDFDSVLPADITISKVEVGLEFYCLENEALRIRVSVDGGSTWSDFSDLFTLTSEAELWLDVTVYKDPWTRDYLFDANWRVEVEFLTEGGSGCFHPDTMITMAKIDEGKYEYEPISGLNNDSRILGYDNKRRKVKKFEEHKVENGTLFYNITTIDNRSLIAYGAHEIVVSPSPPFETKLIANLTSKDQLLCQSGVMVNISRIDPVLLTEFYNILITNSTSYPKGLFYAEGFLVHNLEKGAWTAYLDWIPTRVTYSEVAEEEVDCDWIGMNNTIPGRPTLFSSDWTDLNETDGLSHNLFSTNNTGTWANDTWTDTWYSGNWTRTVKTLNSTLGLVIAFRLYVNDTGGEEYGSTICFFPTMLPVLAIFTFDPSNPRIHETVDFNATESTGEIAVYSWTFGDDNSDSGVTVEHAYNDTGRYLVTLNITDVDGLTDVFTQYVYVENIATTGTILAVAGFAAVLLAILAIIIYIFTRR